MYMKRTADFPYFALFSKALNIFGHLDGILNKQVSGLHVCIVSQSLAVSLKLLFHFKGGKTAGRYETSAYVCVCL